MDLIRDAVVYYHGGGLRVGDLDSEDFSCRRMCKALVCIIEYGLMPHVSATEALPDALHTFYDIWKSKRCCSRKLVVMGSSSRGQLAAHIARLHKGSMDGVLLRSLATVIAAEDCK
jgi:acetyl esterase/lipase